MSLQSLTTLQAICRLESSVEFGWYQLEVRKQGASDFVALRGAALDGFGRVRSTADILMENRLVLLEGNEYSRMFVGRNITSNWRGLTVLERRDGLP
jgi:hypothetical protein